MTEMSREYRSSLHELSRYLAIARQLLVAVAGRLDRKLSTGSAGRRMLIFGAAAGFLPCASFETPLLRGARAQADGCGSSVQVF
jgi:hypothetical protein